MIEGVTLATCKPLVIRRLQTDFAVVTTIEVGTNAISADKKDESAPADIKKREVTEEAQKEKTIDLESVPADKIEDEEVVAPRPARQAPKEEGACMVVEGVDMPCADITIVRSPRAAHNIPAYRRSVPRARRRSPWS